MSERRDEDEILSGCSTGVSTPVCTDESCPNSPTPPPLDEEQPANSSSKKCEEKKDKEKKPEFFAVCYPYYAPVRRSSATTIQRVHSSLPGIATNSYLASIAAPTAVAIGPYYYRRQGSPQVAAMEDSKRAAQELFCRAAGQPRDAVREKMLSLAASARACYAGDTTVDGISDGHLADMLFLDGCFLLQFMVSMCPQDPDAPPEKDQLMSRAEVYSCIDAITRDVLLLENQIPWAVLQALMDLRPGVPVDRFLALLASAFDAGNGEDDEKEKAAALAAHDYQLGHNNHAAGAHHQQRQHQHGDDLDLDLDPPPPHLLGLFHRRQVGAARTQSLRVPRLSSFSTTAVELAEMGVKLSASKTNKFGDMSMEKRLLLGGGKLSLAPMALNNLTNCWIINMAAYEASLGPTQADNFAVSSYVAVVSCLMNREEDVQELRAKGIINSAFSDEMTLQIFKGTAHYLRVGHRYYEVFRGLEEYRQQRWVWIAIHRFIYKNFKTIVTVLSIAGVLAGLFRTILSLKQSQR